MPEELGCGAFESMNWLAYFSDFFSQRAMQIETVLDAGGCREGWVQGEMLLHARNLNLRTNATKARFDMLCPALAATLEAP